MVKLYEAADNKTAPPPFNCYPVNGQAKTQTLKFPDQIKLNKMKEQILFGVKKDAKPWEEIVLSTKPSNFEKVKELAALDGYNRFRVAEIDMSTPPDFQKVIHK